MIQNVSAAALRSKGKTYPVSGIPDSERLVMPPPRSSPAGGSGITNTTAQRPAVPQPEVLAAASATTTSIQKQQGLVTYARLMQLARENRFRTRFDLLL